MSLLDKDNLARQRIEKTRNSYFGFFVERFRIVVLLILAITLLGTVAMLDLPRESDPEVKIPIAVVSTFYPGASPADVENLITDKIENKIEEMTNVKMITSSSMVSISSVVVEFEAEANLEDSIKELKDKVDEISGLPSEAEEPVVTQIRANDYPIITFSLAGNLSESELNQLSEIVQDGLETIPGVSKAPIIGVRDREFSVVVNSGQIERLGISLGQIINAIRLTNIDAPLGDITIDNTNYNLRAVSKLNSLNDIKQIVVGGSNNGLILLGDVAIVSDVFADKKTISRISIDGKPAINSVSIQVFKRTGGNILNIVDEAKAKMENFKNTNVIPKDVYVDVSSDFSVFIRKDLNNLGSSGVQSAVFIFILMFFALSFREAFISFISIPLTFLITFLCLNALGYTLNSLSLFALVLSLGLLVDTFIVILEGMFHNIRSGYNSVEAALLSMDHYMKPLLSGVLTTIAAFIPMLLVSGILGEYLKVLPITISIVLLSSLFVTFIIIPSISAVMLRNSKFKDDKKESLLEKYLTKKLARKYRQFMPIFLKSRKYKITTTLVIVGLFFGSLSLLIFGVIPVKLFPQVDVDFAYINLTMPVGTDLVATDKVIKKIEDRLYDNKDIKNFVSTVGQNNSFDFMSSNGGSNLGSININFIDKEFRSKKSFELTEDIRKEISDINEGEIVMTEISTGPPTGSPIEVRIMGDDLNVLDSLTENVKEKLKKTDGVINVRSNREISPADLIFKLNKNAIANAGLSVADVTSTIRTSIFGVTATEISNGDKDIDVIVKLDKTKISTVEDISNLSVVGQGGNSVKLSQVAEFSLTPALAVIRHRDFERTITIQADLRPGFTPTTIIPNIEKEIKSDGIPYGYKVNFGGEVEDIEKSFSELWNAMIVAVLLILLILVLQFDSFVVPIAILMSIPLALIGVVFGMLLLNLDFSFSVFLGIVSLAGIVVNDSIVLLDKTQRNIKEKNMRPVEALADAGETRLQPILLTSLTTIVGVIPLALMDEFWLGLSISIIFGLAFATILQLFIIPMIYLRLDGKAVLKTIKKVNNI